MNDTTDFEMFTRFLEDTMIKLKAGDVEAIKGLGGTMEKALPALEKMVKKLEVQKRASQIVEQMDRKFRRLERLTPDFAEPRFTVLSKKYKWEVDDSDQPCPSLVLAEFVYDHIEFHFGGWSPELKTWIHYAHVFNHEVLHGVIGRIETEDDIEHEEMHFPMICGLDEMFGFCMAHTNPTEFLSIPVFVEEREAFGDSHFNSLRKSLTDLASE